MMQTIAGKAVAFGEARLSGVQRVSIARRRERARDGRRARSRRRPARRGGHRHAPTPRRSRAEGVDRESGREPISTRSRSRSIKTRSRSTRKNRRSRAASASVRPRSRLAAWVSAQAREIGKIIGEALDDVAERRKIASARRPRGGTDVGVRRPLAARGRYDEATQCGFVNSIPFARRSPNVADADVRSDELERTADAREEDSRRIADGACRRRRPPNSRRRSARRRDRRGASRCRVSTHGRHRSRAFGP